MRVLMARHGVSLSTAVQVCRQLESDGWLEARPRSGNFVRLPRRSSVPPSRWRSTSSARCTPRAMREELAM